MSIHSLAGAKGGGGSFTQRPDTLRSDDNFEIVLGMGSGRWKGLSKGLQSVYFNGVQIEDEDGQKNFDDVVVIVADGDPTQEQQVVFKIGAGSSQTSVGTQLANTNPSAPGPWVTTSITTPGVDHIDLRFVVQQLFKQTKSGIYENRASIEIEMKPSGSSTWTNIFSTLPTTTYNQNGTPVTLYGGGNAFAYLMRSWFESTGHWRPDPYSGALQIDGKTTSPYVREIRISVPNEGAYAGRTWSVRCRLRELDTVDNGTDDQQKRNIVWESIGASIADKWGTQEGWRGLVWMQIQSLASKQITGMPKVESIWDTKICAVPPSTVFNPDTRLYSGSVWDGTFEYAYTDDPAWCIKAFIEDSVSGVAALAPGSTLNKWDCLEASKYYSELVPDGAGGYQPRFSMNASFKAPQAIEDAVAYLAGAVNSIAWEESPGKWRLKVNKPENPVAVFTPENIVGGEFFYSRTPVDQRANDITMTFNNEELLFEPDFVRSHDQPDIDVRGRVPAQLVAVGAKHRQEALRRAEYRKLVNLHETQIVSFPTNRQGLMVEKYDTVLIADPDFGVDQTTGRLIGSLTGTTLTCRDPIRLEVGVAYQIKLTVPNPNYRDPDASTQPTTADWRSPTVVITRNITNTSGQRGNVTTLYVDSALPAGLPANPVFALSATGLPALPIPFQIVDIEPMEDGETVRLSGLEIYTPKWAAMDAVTESALANQPRGLIVPPPVLPGAGMFKMSTVDADITHTHLQINWMRPAGALLEGYRIEQSINNGPFELLANNFQETSYELVDLPLGAYTFRIYTQDRRGSQSLPLEGSYTVTTLANATPTPFTLQPDNANVRVTGATVTKVGGSSGGYDVGATSVERWKNGAFCSFTLGQLNDYTTVGLNSDPATDHTDVSIDYAFASEPNVWKIKEGGSFVSGATGARTLATVFSIAYDGVNIRYYVDGALVRTVVAGADLTFSLDSSLAIIDASFTVLAFAPAGAVGATGAPGTHPDFKFIISPVQPPVPTGSAPAGWSDGVPPGSGRKWISNCVKDAADNVVGAWTTPQSLSDLVPRGAYNSGVTYYPGDTVTLNGGTYLAIVGGSGHAPSGTDQDNTYWAVIAAPGPAGVPGTPPSAFSATLTLSATDTNLRTRANAAGYTGLSAATITFVVPAGVTIRGLPGGRGLDTGTWPSGYAIALTLLVENGGVVDGGGGSGGRAPNGTGQNGGDAVYCQAPITINISAGGTVRGGGGGGGGGSNYTYNLGWPEPEYFTRGGGGGGGGAPNGAGGSADVSADFAGSDGAAGTTSGGGAGGAGYGGGTTAGGNGGGFATNGTGGTGQNGLAGYAVRKNGHTVPVTNSGTMTGSAA